MTIAQGAATAARGVTASVQKTSATVQATSVAIQAGSTAIQMRNDHSGIYSVDRPLNLPIVDAFTQQSARLAGILRGFDYEAKISALAPISDF